MDNGKDVEINIVDMIGKKVLTVYNGIASEGTNNYNVNTSEISKGVYFINVVTEGKSISKKLIIE